MIYIRYVVWLLDSVVPDKNDGSFSRSRSSSMSSLENVSKEAIQCLVFADSYTRKQGYLIVFCYLLNFMTFMQISSQCREKFTNALISGIYLINSCYAVFIHVILMSLSCFALVFRLGSSSTSDKN